MEKRHDLCSNYAYHHPVNAPRSEEAGWNGKNDVIRIGLQSKRGETDIRISLEGGAGRKGNVISSNLGCFGDGEEELKSLRGSKPRSLSSRVGAKVAKDIGAYKLREADEGN